MSVACFCVGSFSVLERASDGKCAARAYANLGQYFLEPETENVSAAVGCARLALRLAPNDAHTTRLLNKIHTTYPDAADESDEHVMGELALQGVPTSPSAEIAICLIMCATDAASDGDKQEATRLTVRARDLVGEEACAAIIKLVRESDAELMLARLPRIAAFAHMASVAKLRGSEVHVPHPTPGLSTAETILQVLRGGMAFTRDEAMLLDVMLMLHAEHGGGNNSTFACRVLSSSATDPYSAYAAAIGSLKGPRHGGANAKVVSMHEDIRAHVSNWEDEDEVAAYLGKILDKQAFDGTGLIYGMGHAVYTLSDPRAEVCRRYARSLAAKKDLGEEFALIERIERLAPQVMRDHGMTKPICANIDLYTGFIYKMLGVPETLFTPLFAVARMAGWSAHRMEELFCAHRIIRPAYRPVIEPLEYKPLADR